MGILRPALLATGADLVAAGILDRPEDVFLLRLQELLDLRIECITQPERYFLLAATGDEVLDWRQMRDHYPGARQHIIEGSDHAISEFADHIHRIAEFSAVGVTQLSV